ncbi:zinc finger transcriptional factor charlatan [Lycorma delicatula]|uniref:zinc finger transcriptional factor charlatan n=1 Tax=Lycorma delicatula TaxID=130591 RepID=UPI003F519632
MEIYEDMFKEITRKLYGDDKDTNDSLQMVPQYSSGNVKKDETTVFDGKHKPNEDRWISSEESIPWTSSKIASYNSSQKLFRCNECECVGYLSRVAEHWLGTHANLRVFQCPQCPYASAWARCVRMHLARQHNVCPEQNGESVATFWKESPVLEEVTKYLQRLKAKIENEPPPDEVKSQEPITYNSTPAPLNNTVNSSTQTQTQSQTKPPTENSKRYNCTYCHYATDRRDLFTRHENIHKDEKPFHCYVCFKQFNRADHIKKHFLRMHREHQYDMSRTKRETSSNSQFPPPITDYLKKQKTENEREVVRQPLNIPGYPIRPEDSKRSPRRKPGEKRYTCCYCTWSGVDNWCLKRHLNTHLKPFTCSLCEYKAARSERLSLHLFKVHNKHPCSRCSFLTDDQASLTAHQQQQHNM